MTVSRTATSGEPAPGMTDCSGSVGLQPCATRPPRCKDTSSVRIRVSRRQAALQGGSCERCAVANAELLVDPLHMGLDGLRRHEELATNLCVLPTAHQQGQHFELSGGQALAARSTTLAVKVNQQLQDLGAENQLS